MNTLDRLKYAAAGLADAAVRTTDELTQKGKKQMRLLTLENNLSRAQRQLGALVYMLHKHGEKNDALVERYIESIDEVEQEIAALCPEDSEPSEESKTTLCCPQCGAEVDPDALFCTRCGGKL